MKNIFLTLALTLCIFSSCDKIGNGDEWSGDWSNGRLTGDYETFTVEMTFSEDWESTAMRFNAMIDDWFSYSPTKGKAGKNLITFRVSTNENILDDGVISFTFNDNEFVDIEIYKGYSDDMDLTISGEPISNLNLSNFKQLRYLGIASTSVFSLDLSECSYLEYVYTGSDDGDTSNGINKILTEIWLREGQDVEFEGDGNYEVKYK